VGGLRQCHQVTQRGGGGRPKCHVSFLSIFELNFTAKVFKSYVFNKMKIVTSHRGRGGGGGGGEGQSHCHQMTQGEGGLK